MTRKELHSLHSVCGTAIGYKYINGQRTDAIGVVVYVRKKRPASEIKAQALIPKTIDGMVTDVQELNAVPFKPSRMMWWPVAPAGVSVGHFSITAGTLGLYMKHAERPETMILSNNHVLAATNSGVRGHRIHQPGPIDEEPDLMNAIGQLYDFEFIKFMNQPGPPDECGFANAVAKVFNTGARLIGSQSVCTMTDAAEEEPTNLIDAAIATVDREDTIDRRLLDGNNIPTISVNSITVAGLGDMVKKSGRTTDMTHGQVIAIDGIVDVTYGPALVARFTDQIFIGPLENELIAFSKGGDSGSVILTEENDLVGLLFAGDSAQNITIANNIEHVLARFSLGF